MSEMEWKNSLLQRFDAGIELLAASCPRGYLLAASALALAGYGWLLLFPWLVLAGVSGVFDAVTGQPDVAWGRLLIWSAAATGAALVTCRMARFSPALPAGIVLDRKKAPALLELVDELRRQYRAPWIDRVVINGEFTLDIVNTPYSALPAWSTNTLVIGLPLIQSLSPDQFRCALARRLGQFSKRHNPLGNRLYRLRRIWPLYAIESTAAGAGFQPVRWFFMIFAPLYGRVSLPAARLDELAADSYAMEVCSDEEVLDTITTETVCRLFLEEKYWPTYRKLTARVREVLPKPHAGMASVLRTGLQGDKCQEWLTKALNREPLPDDAMPSLARRVENIGHRKPRMSGIAPESAAPVYLAAAIEELDAALGLALPKTTPQERTCTPCGSSPCTLLASLTHRFRHRHIETPAARSHDHITTLQ
jgi:Zn-dependent protease with chaperone function